MSIDLDENLNINARLGEGVMLDGGKITSASAPTS